MADEDEIYMSHDTAVRVGQAVRKIEQDSFNLRPPAPSKAQSSMFNVRPVRITGSFNTTYKYYPAEVVYHDYTEASVAARFKTYTPNSVCWVYVSSIVSATMVVGDIVEGLLIDFDASDIPIFLFCTALHQVTTNTLTYVGSTLTSTVNGVAAAVTIASAATLATTNADGTQSGTSSTLAFDQAQGVHITQGTPDTVSIYDATASQPGVVSTTTQIFAGLKQFNAEIYVNYTNADNGSIFVCDGLTGSDSSPALNIYSVVTSPVTHPRIADFWLDTAGTGDYSKPPGTMRLNGSLQHGDATHDRAHNVYGDYGTNKIVAGTVLGSPLKYWKIWDLTASVYVYIPVFAAGAFTSSV